MLHANLYLRVAGCKAFAKEMMVGVVAGAGTGVAFDKEARRGKTSRGDWRKCIAYRLGWPVFVDIRINCFSG